MADTEVDEILGTEEDGDRQTDKNTDNHIDGEPPATGDAEALPDWQRVGSDDEWDAMFPGPDMPPPPEPHDQVRPERVRPLRKPVAPTKAQRERHELTHLPYADWCRHCVRARAQNDPHRKVKKHASQNTVPTVSGDFCFLKQAGQEGTYPVHVMRDHNTRLTFAHLVQGKSTTKELYSAYLVNAIMQYLRDLD